MLIGHSYLCLWPIWHRVVYLATKIHKGEGKHVRTGIRKANLGNGAKDQELMRHLDEKKSVAAGKG
jgi:hypothetical protein